jgi:hypothetical protein
MACFNSNHVYPTQLVDMVRSLPPKEMITPLTASG